MLDLHRLRLLVEFAARGSIAGTAAFLGYTPSAVSQQLAVLEREAGTALLDRSARRAELTDAGRRLAGHAERILAMVEEAETDLSARATEPAGRVVATAFPSAAVAFAPALARSLRTHPRLALVLRQTQAADGLRQVRSGEVDVAIVDDWNSRLATEIEAGGSILTCYHLIRDELVLVLPRTHPAADPGQAVDSAGAAERALAGRAGRGIVPAGRRPAARRGGRDAAGTVGVRGHVDDREPGGPGHWHRHLAADSGHLGGPPGGGAGPATRPRPGQGHSRRGPYRERTPPLGGGDRDRVARRREGDADPGSPGIRA